MAQSKKKAEGKISGGGMLFPAGETPASMQRKIDERNRAKLRSRNVSSDQSNVQKVYRWVRQNWSKPGPYGK